MLFCTVARVARLLNPPGLNDAGGCLRTGNQILDRWGFGDWPLWASYVGLVGASHTDDGS